MYYYLKNGQTVSDKLPLHTSEDVLPHLAEALKSIDPRGRTEIKEEVDFGKTIGYTRCVPTTSSDRIIWAQRTRRNRYTRFVEDRQPIPTSKLTVILLPDDRRRANFVIIACYIGKIAYPEPGDRYEHPMSREFWERHAIIWDTMDIVPGTETTLCPW